MEFIKFLLEISWKHIVIATVAGLVAGGCNALLISLINREVHQGHSANALSYFALLALFIVITSILSQFVLIYLTQNAIYELRLKLSENILAAPLQHLEALQENRLIVSFSEDVHVLTHAICAIPNICIDLATVVGCFIYLAWFSSALFVFTIASTVSAIWFVQTKLNQAQRWFFEAREEEDTLLKHFQGIITGIKELKLNRSRRREFMDKRMRRSANKLRQRNTKAMKSFALANGFGQTSQFISLGFILFLLPVFLDIPISVLATYVLIGTFIALPMQNLLNRIPELVRGNVALSKIQRMKLSLSTLAEVSGFPAKISEKCELELREVCYLYPPYEPPEEFGETHAPPPPLDRDNDHLPPPPPGGFPGTDGHPPEFAGGQLPPPPQGHPQGFADAHLPPPPEGYLPGQKFPPPPHLQRGGGFMPPPHFPERGFQLGPLSLTVKPGELVFIIGGNGSGKSTLAKLITGLYEPQAGEIYLNKKAIARDNLEWYRQHFSAIFSDFYLFESYLGFNYPNLDRRVEAYLDKLRLAHKVRVRDGVLSTTSLSLGQRQRLALLSAYLEDRPIYLFDEWASDQEPEFRELFYKQMLRELKEQGKIVIVITHDDRYFHLADHLVKLDYGHIEFDRTSERIAQSKLITHNSDEI